MRLVLSRSPLARGRIAALAAIAILAAIPAPADELTDGFERPPASARPRVWWHWMNGNITQEGIRLDLEWMNRVGIAGFQNFDAALATPQVVEKRLVYMTPEWQAAFRYAISLGDKFGMEMAIAGSPGWSETGGPWVPASQGMKKYVWSETLVEGGKPFTGSIAHPPSNTGAFQNMGLREQLGAPGAHAAPQFYADAAVIAFRTRSGDREDAGQARITSSGDGLEPALLSDGDLEKTTGVPIPAPGEESWIQFEYPSPQTIRAVTYVTKDPGMMEVLVSRIGAPEKTLEASDDGRNFRRVASLSGGAAPEHTVSFAPVTAKYFRVAFKRNPPPPVPLWAQGLDPAAMGIKAPAPPTHYQVAELVLHSDPRVNHFEEKAAFAPEGDLYQYATPEVDRSIAIQESGRRRSDSEDASRWHARLDTARGPMGGSAPGLLTAGNHQSPGHARSDRPRGGQTRSPLREGLLREVSGQLQADGGRG